MYTVYVTGPRTQTSVTSPLKATALFLASHLRVAGLKIRVWGHAERKFLA